MDLEFRPVEKYQVTGDSSLERTQPQLSMIHSLTPQDLRHTLKR